MLAARLTMILFVPVVLALQFQATRATAAELDLHTRQSLRQGSATMGKKTIGKKTTGKTTTAKKIADKKAAIEKQVLTPGGPRPPSQVHQIAPGHVLDASGGRLRELDADGHVVADFGPVPTEKHSGRPTLPGKRGSPE